MIVENPRRLRLQKFLAHGFLIGFLILIMFPFFMVLSISLREGNFSTGALIPQNPTLEHWALALGLDFTRPDGKVITPPYPVLLWMWNSVKIAIATSAGVLTIATISGYAFSRIPFQNRKGLLDAFFILQMFPNVLYLIAIYAIFDSLGNVSKHTGLDSHISLIMVYLSGILMHVWTIKGYFDGVDRSLDRAAQIDGATPWQAFRFVFLPLAVPILAVVFVLVFIGVINDYPVASVLLRSPEKLTLAVGSSFYLNKDQYLWGDFAAAAILAGVPITIVFLIAQKYLVSGLADGAVKG